MRILKTALKYLQIVLLAFMALSTYQMSRFSEANVDGVSFDNATEQMIGLALAVVLCVIAIRKWMNPPVNAVDIVLAIFFGILIFPKLFTFLWFVEIELGNYWSGVIAYGIASIIVCKGIVRYVGIPQKVLLIVSIAVMVINFVVGKMLVEKSFWEMPLGTIDKISIYVQINGLVFFGVAVLTAITIINLTEDKWFPPLLEKHPT